MKRLKKEIGSSFSILALKIMSNHTNTFTAKWGVFWLKYRIIVYALGLVYLSYPPLLAAIFSSYKAEMKDQQALAGLTCNAAR